MYAIRSYYDTLWTIISGLAQMGIMLYVFSLVVDSPLLSGARITSYNVCYTKLLRSVKYLVLYNYGINGSYFQVVWK